MSACSSIVADRISQQQSYDYSWFVTDAKLAQEGFDKQRYCSVQHGLCLSYLAAEAKPDDAYAFEMVAHYDPIKLQLDRRQLKANYNGTVVLLHGFAISKEYMTMTASYFRFLGFDVIIPDLLGHGESGGSIGFGWQDAQIIDELLSHGLAPKQPVLLFGNSMGAVTAARLAANREDVAGVMLQAPMLPFDTAAFNYVRFDAPWLARLVTERSIRKGAVKALERQSVPLQVTDLRPTIAELHVPVLILASSADTIAPYEYFQGLETAEVTVAEIHNRNHYSMVVIDQEDHQHIAPWLQTHFAQ